MKALIIGLGSAGRRHARNWARLQAGEVWICRQQGAPQPEPLGVDARTFTSLEEALSEAPDLAIVANPTSLHVETTLQAVRAGCHVLVEKPLGSDLGQVGLLLREAERRGRLVMVGYTLRFHPGLARMRELLHAGAIGRPLYARAEMGEYLPGWHPWEDYRQGYSARRNLGGGPILTFSHELDALCWLLGPPHKVGCLAAHVSTLAIDTEDIAEITLAFESGVIGSVRVDYVRRPPRRAIEIVAEQGVLQWEYEQNRLVLYATETSEWRELTGLPPPERNQMFLDELACVAVSVERGELIEPLAGGQQGAAVLAVASAAARAASEERVVEMRGPGEMAEVSRWLESFRMNDPVP